MTINDWLTLSSPQKAALIAAYRTPAKLNTKHFAWQTLDFLARKGWIHRQWPDKRYSLDSAVYTTLKDLEQRRMLI